MPSCCTPCAAGLGSLGDSIGPFWPSDVNDFVSRLDISFQTTNRSVLTCQGLPASTSLSWKDFFTGWGKFRDEGTGIFGAGGRMDQARQYERDLQAWQALIGAAKCDLSAPLVEGAPDNAPSLIKWIAAAAILGGVIYLAGPAIRSTLTRLAK